MPAPEVRPTTSAGRVRPAGAAEPAKHYDSRGVVLFVNESHFAYLIARPLVEALGSEVCTAVFSTRITSSARAVMQVFRRVHWRYFVYRSLVDGITRANRLRGRGCVRALLKARGVPILETRSINATCTADGLRRAALGVALNFDQVLGRDVLARFDFGVLNLHASRLPHGKGISPALWAFARGEAALWASVYEMGAHVDCGHILAQFEIPVLPSESAFSAYARLCATGGAVLAAVASDRLQSKSRVIGESREDEGSYDGWPDSRHAALLMNSGRKLWSWRDLAGALR